MVTIPDLGGVQCAIVESDGAHGSSWTLAIFMPSVSTSLAWFLAEMTLDAPSVCNDHDMASGGVNSARVKLWPGGMKQMEGQNDSTTAFKLEILAPHLCDLEPLNLRYRQIFASGCVTGSLDLSPRGNWKVLWLWRPEHATEQSIVTAYVILFFTRQRYVCRELAFYTSSPERIPHGVGIVSSNVSSQSCPNLVRQQPRCWVQPSNTVGVPDASRKDCLLPSKEKLPSVLVPNSRE